MLLRKLIPLLAFALMALPSKGQDNVPVLEEWYSLNDPQIGYFSYLQNFIIPGGENAITIKRRIGEKPVTWFNRFPMDTVNQFYWPNASNGCVHQGDFNGDGITDYIDCEGNIYKGIENGVPPDTVPVAQYSIPGFGFTHDVTDDFNNDGYQDIIAGNGSGEDSFIFSFLFGGQKLNSLQTFLFKNDTSIATRQFIGAYKTDNGARLVTLEWDKKHYYHNHKYILYGMQFKNQNDSTIVELNPLDSVGYFSYYDEQYDFFHGYYGYGSKIYKSHNSKKIFMIADSVMNWDKTEDAFIIFEIKNDKFVYKDKESNKYMYPSNQLNQSVDGDEFEDIITSGYDNNKPVFYLIENGNNFSFKVRAKFYPWLLSSRIMAIGDINKDGINDFAIGSTYQHGGIEIFLGKDLRTGIETRNYDFSTDFKLSQNEPNPVGSDLHSYLPVDVSYPDRYKLKLFSLDGGKIADLFDDNLTEGSHRLELNLSQYSLQSGFYVIRLFNSRTTKERGILIAR